MYGIDKGNPSFLLFLIAFPFLDMGRITSQPESAKNGTKCAEGKLAHSEFCCGAFVLLVHLLAVVLDWCFRLSDASSFDPFLTLFGSSFPPPTQN